MVNSYKPKDEKYTNALYQVTDYMMMTLPSPRVNYYQSSNYFTIQKRVTDYANECIEKLGFFPVGMKMKVLE
jgi:hypothetical protein